MTKLLEQAIAKVKELPDIEQDGIAVGILAKLEDEPHWGAGDAPFLSRVEARFSQRLPLVLDSVLRARTVAALERSVLYGADYLWEGCRSRLTRLNREAISESQLIDDQPDHIFKHGDHTELRRVTRLEQTAEGSAVVVKLIAHGAHLGELVVERPGEARFSRQECGHIRIYAEMCSSALHSLLAMEELRRLALTDQLTGAPNRRALLNELEKLAHEPNGIALLFLDVDGLKSVNDTIGYQAGNTLIAALAEVLVSAIGDGDFPGRLGGDEFVAVLRNADESRAARVRARVEEAFASWPLPAEIVAQCRGVSVDYVLRRDGEPSADLLQRAEQKMKARKQRRREDRAG